MPQRTDPFRVPRPKRKSMKKPKIHNARFEWVGGSERIHKSKAKSIKPPKWKFKLRELKLAK